MIVKLVAASTTSRILIALQLILRFIRQSVTTSTTVTLQLSSDSRSSDSHPFIQAQLPSQPAAQ